VSKSAKSHNFRETRSPGDATITNNVDGGMTEFFNLPSENGRDYIELECARRRQ
jgi:hypothetical protein